MRRAVEYARHYGGVLYRHPGGHWARKHWNHEYKAHSTPTVAALVRRGFFRYTEYQKARAGGEFPVRVELVESSTKVTAPQNDNNKRAGDGVDR